MRAGPLRPVSHTQLPCNLGQRIVRRPKLHARHPRRRQQVRIHPPDALPVQFVRPHELDNFFVGYGRIRGSLL